MYDNSDLCELNTLKGIIDWNKTENAVLVHASFDPLSKRLEEKYQNLNPEILLILFSSILGLFVFLSKKQWKKAIFGGGLKDC